MKNSGSHMTLADFKLYKTVFTLVLLSLIFAFSTTTHAKNLSVKTDRQSVEMGDVITLIVEADFQTKTGQIDLKNLEEQFDILNRQQSNQVAIINGDYRSFTQWRLQLLPKQTGLLMLPSFSVDGVESKPYPINVAKAQYSDGNAPYFLQAKVDKTEAYVQEQVIYTLRFFHKGSLISGNIRPPQFEDALVEQLKEQSVYGKTINGQQYTVYEWQYAVFPQSSGNMVVPGPSFSGMVQLRGGQKGVRALADAISIDVLQKPSKNETTWLPAESVKIKESWVKLPDTIHVGDSLKRVIKLEVKGLKASQLPEITVANSDSYKVYQDTSKQRQTISENGISSVISFSQAVVPTKDGTLTLPDINLQWWNTKTKKMETTVLKSKSLTILPASTAIPPVIQSTDTTQNLEMGNVNQATTPHPVYDQDQSTQSSSVWFYVSLVLVLLWVMTLVLFFNIKTKLNRTIQELEGSHVPQNHHDKLKFDKQWCNLPLNEFYQELLRQLREDFNIGSVQDIPNEHLREAVFQLESHLFGGEDLGYKTMQTICDNWAALIQRENESHTPSKSKLADKGLLPLYKK